MSWLSVSFETGAAEVEAVTDALIEAGALAVEVGDAQAGSRDERPVFAEGAGPPAAWRRNLVRVLLDSGADAGSILAQACARTGIGMPQYVTADVPDRDWVRATRSQFEPIRISRRLWIVPSWRTPPDPAAVNVVLDPGIAFGTGSHPTTRLCLAWLAREIAGGESVLDYGCGSGILAIAAMRLGAARASGIDVDPQALLAARGNALQNRVEVEFRAAADSSGAAADVVVANILAHPLIVLAPALAMLAVRGGRLALSGILAGQAGEVRAAYARWFDLAVESVDEGWVLLAGARR
ncbi:MAG: 50S ribosomal protein L11 methyltransferase [Burkholderiales bacterium]|nr:50S ribosomal protein L11 methyltransferase [Burkholderiales bacterium]